MKHLVLALGGLAAVAAVPSPAAAQAVWECTVGQQIVDSRGTPGVVAAAHGDKCLIKYNGGRAQGWAPWQSLRAQAAAKHPPLGATAPPAPVASPPDKPPSGAQSATVPKVNEAAKVSVVRPPVNNQLVFHADPRGHVLLTASANGAPVRFMIDTGASLVFLTGNDARAAGLNTGELVFDRTVQTANGPVRAAFVVLREIGIGELSIEKVPAAVIDGLGQSVLGMSFLSRLKGFEMRDRVLTIHW